MKHSILIFIFLYSFVPLVLGQQDQVLLKIGNSTVSKEEFERIYKKNNNNLYNESDKRTPEEYIDMFIDFKLKVLEAQALKMDTNSVFVNELRTYRKELAAPYLTDMKFSKELIRELYRRITLEVNASHILLRLNKEASATEEKSVLDRIYQIKKEIEEGLDFGEAAIKYSEDPSAQKNKGNLSYFSAFQMVAPFENAAFSTSVDQVSDPVRSSFGYHLIKVHDVRKNKGQIQVAHIMKSFPQNASEEIKEKLLQETRNIHIELQNGADFAELAKRKSDDKRSAAKGGELPWFAAGRMVKEFSDPAFNLQKVGDFTKPVATPFGYHIIKKLDERPIKSFEELEKEIENKIKRDPERSLSGKKAFIEKLKGEYNYTPNTEELALLNDQKVEDGLKKADAKLFTILDKEFKAFRFNSFLKKEKINNGYYKNYFDKWVESEIIAYEDSLLEEKHPEFRYVMQEYHDGILLFNISEEKIWNYAIEDSLGLENFYRKSKKKHMWKERFKGKIVICTDVNTREEVDSYFAENLSTEEIIDLLNGEEEVVIIEDGAWEQGDNQIVDYFVWNGETPVDMDSRLTFVRGNKVDPEEKSLEDARGLYISDYQKFLEKKWIKELGKKYKVVINKKLLKTISGV